MSRPWHSHRVTVHAVSWHLEVSITLLSPHRLCSIPLSPGTIAPHALSTASAYQEYSLFCSVLDSKPCVSCMTHNTAGLLAGILLRLHDPQAAPGLTGATSRR